jgi:hypothetical protein
LFIGTSRNNEHVLLLERGGDVNSNLIFLFMP